MIPVGRERWRAIVFWGLVCVLGLVALIRGADADLFGEPQVWQAFIAGVFIAGGWLVNAQIERDNKAAERAERCQDISLALSAEIGAMQYQLVRGKSVPDGIADLEKTRDEFSRRIEVEDIVPFVPTEHNDTVYRTFLPNIQLLDAEQIRLVVAFYDTVKNCEDLAADMRGESYACLPADRRAAIYTHFMNMKITLLKQGSDATTALKKGPAPRQ